VLCLLFLAAHRLPRCLTNVAAAAAACCLLSGARQERGPLASQRHGLRLLARFLRLVRLKHGLHEVATHCGASRAMQV